MICAVGYWFIFCFEGGTTSLDNTGWSGKQGIHFPSVVSVHKQGMEMSFSITNRVVILVFKWNTLQKSGWSTTQDYSILKTPVFKTSNISSWACEHITVKPCYLELQRDVISAKNSPSTFAIQSFSYIIQTYYMLFSYYNSVRKMSAAYCKIECVQFKLKICESHPGG